MNFDMIDKAIKKAEEGELVFGISRSLYEVMEAPTPEKYVKKRAGRGGKDFDYVEVGYVQDQLNKVFNGMWSFEITDQQVGTSHVWVLGKLTVKIMTPSGVQEISKMQFGGSELKRSRDGNGYVDVGDDLKAASSDALKKCASLIGIAKDIYWKQDESIRTGETVHSASPSGNQMYRITDKQINFINGLCSKKGVDREALKKENGVTMFEALSLTQAKEVIDRLLKMPDKAVEAKAQEGSEDIDPNDLPF